MRVHPTAYEGNSNYWKAISTTTGPALPLGFAFEHLEIYRAAFACAKSERRTAQCGRGLLGYNILNNSLNDAFHMKKEIQTTEHDVYQDMRLRSDPYRM